MLGVCTKLMSALVEESEMGHMLWALVSVSSIEMAIRLWSGQWFWCENWISVFVIRWHVPDGHDLYSEFV